MRLASTTLLTLRRGGYSFSPASGHQQKNIAIYEVAGLHQLKTRDCIFFAPEVIVIATKERRGLEGREFTATRKSVTGACGVNVFHFHFVLVLSWGVTPVPLSLFSVSTYQLTGGV